MKLFAFAVFALAVGSSIVLLAPEAEAAQYCTRYTQSWCPGTVCVWNHLEHDWSCTSDVHCTPDLCRILP